MRATRRSAATRPSSWCTGTSGPTRPSACASGASARPCWRCGTRTSSPSTTPGAGRPRLPGDGAGPRRDARPTGSPARSTRSRRPRSWVRSPTRWTPRPRRRPGPPRRHARQRAARPRRPWLADFGIARRVDATAMTADGLLVGTAGYLAPEVIEGRPAGPAADRYALAAVAFEALTGRPPFRGRRRAGPALRPRQPPRAAGLVAAPRPGAGRRRPRSGASRRTPGTGPRRPASWSSPSAPGPRGRAGASAAPPARPWWRPSPAAAGGAATRAGPALAGGREPAPPAPPATVVTEPPLTVPAPGGRDLPAHPAAADDLPGLAGTPARRPPTSASCGWCRCRAARGRWRPPPRPSRAPGCGSSR